MPTLIDYILAAEFDNKEGTTIVCTYPPDKPACTESDHLLGDYLIPDGMHRTDRDTYIFKSVLAVPVTNISIPLENLNKSQVRANVFTFASTSKKMFEDADFLKDGWSFQVTIMENKFLMLNYFKGGQPKHFAFFLSQIELVRLADRFYAIRQPNEEHLSQIIEFENYTQSQEIAYFADQCTSNLKFRKLIKIPDGEKLNIFLQKGWFLTACSNKKDNLAERGTVYRSVSLFSSKINIFEVFRSFAVKSLDTFAQLPPKPRWAQNEFQQLQENLTSLFKQCNMNTVYLKTIDQLTIQQSAHYSAVKTEEIQLVRSVGILENALMLPRLLPTSTKTLLGILGLDAMVIYRGIINEKNIVFFGDKAKVEFISGLVSACLSLAAPLNIIDRLMPFEHIQSLDLVKQSPPGYIVGYTNPIVASTSSQKTLRWDLLVDLSAGNIKDHNLKPVVAQEALIPNDLAFGEQVLRRINEDLVDGSEVDSFFETYTRNSLAAIQGRSANLRLEREEESVVQSLISQRTLFNKTRSSLLTDLAARLEREEFSSLYGKRYLGVYQTYKMFSECGATLPDMDLIVAMENLRLEINTVEKAEFFLKKLKTATGSFSMLTTGLLSEDETLKSLCAKVLQNFEICEVWKKDSSEAGLFEAVILAIINLFIFSNHTWRNKVESLINSENHKSPPNSIL